jgi:hypothetical protein
VLALGLATTNVSLFLLYGLAFENATATLPYEGDIGTVGRTVAMLGLASYVVTAGIFVVPLLLIYRRQAIFGATAIMVAMAGVFHMGTREFPSPQTAGVVGTLAAALLVDAILVRLDTVRGVDAPFRLPLVGLVAGGLLTAGHLVGLAVDDGVLWPAELWSGIPISCAAVGALLGGLAARPTTYPARFDEAAASAVAVEKRDTVAAA